MDSILVFPPGASGVTGVGSAIQLGSWLNAEAGADYGAGGLIESVQAMNSLRDGGQFAYRRAPIRHMAIPLIINTPSVVQWEGMLARYTTPGAYIAVQPEGIPSSQAVYFDVIDGRWEPAYNTFENRAHVRRGVLHLDTQPYGYWPTEILLASAASIGFIGQLAVNGASVFGDVPPLAHVTITPTAASQYPLASTKWGVDMVGLSFGARPSFTPFIPPAAFVTGGGISPTLIADTFAPASQAWQSGPYTPGVYGFIQLLDSATYISSALEPAYRGRFRVFAFARAICPSVIGGVPCPGVLAAVDSDRFNAGLAPALAQANTQATISFGANIQGLPNSLLTASPGYHLYDMGEVTLPPQGSGFQQGVRLRWWWGGGTVVPTTTILFGGLYLLPVDAPAGILTRGMFAPTLNVGSQGGAEWNANFVDGSLFIRAPGGGGLYSDGRPYYRGLSPRLGASTTALTFLMGDRPVGVTGQLATNLVGQANFEYAQVSVSYRPQFQFLYGI